MEGMDNITTEAREFCGTFEASVNGTRFDWMETCLKLAMLVSDKFGILSPVVMSALQNFKYVKIIIEERGYNIQSREEYENASKLFGFPVAYCASIFKRQHRIVKCSNILSNHTILDLGGVTTFCKQNEEFQSAWICSDVLKFTSMVFNITQYFKFDEELIFYSYFYPVVVLLVLLSNILLVVTFLRGRFLSAAHLLLVAISLMDSLTVVLPSPYFFYYLTLGNYDSYIPYNHCIAINAILLYISPICHGISIWLNFGLALQRYILLWHRTYLSSSLLRRKYCIIFMLVILLVVVAVFTPGIMTLTYYPVVYAHSSNNEEIMTTLKSPILGNSQSRFAQTYFARCMIIQLLPCMGMLMLSVELVLKWKSAVKANRKMTTNERGNGDAESTRTFNMVVLYMLAIFLLAEIPTAYATFNVSWAMISNGTVDEYVRVIGFITNIIISITSPLNLLVYVCQGAHFRQNLKQLLCCRPRQETRSGDWTRSRMTEIDQ
ncbi:sex peptide receptor-like [Pecten maximus]|uniref:sex peptide receptor-like n=1 Tax=Pecten maximus TaxID=6579 RepID=UPI001458D470|nr:sex peptide receptor-like [Pecten maximus]